MSLKPTISSIPRENIPGAPSWIENLLYPVNLFIQGINQGWTSLNYRENFDCEEKSVQIFGNATPGLNIITIALTKAQRPKEIRVRQIYQSDNLGSIFTVDVKWTYNNGVVTINSIPDLQTGVLYTILLVIFYQ